MKENIPGIAQETTDINKNPRLGQEINQSNIKSADEEVDEIINRC